MLFFHVVTFTSYSLLFDLNHSHPRHCDKPDEKCHCSIEMRSVQLEVRMTSHSVLNMRYPWKHSTQEVFVSIVMV